MKLSPGHALGALVLLVLAGASAGLMVASVVLFNASNLAAILTFGLLLITSTMLADLSVRWYRTVTGKDT